MPRLFILIVEVLLDSRLRGNDRTGTERGAGTMKMGQDDAEVATIIPAQVSLALLHSGMNQTDFVILFQSEATAS